MVSILMWINGHYCFNSLCQKNYLFAILNNYLSVFISILIIQCVSQVMTCPQHGHLNVASKRAIYQAM